MASNPGILTVWPWKPLGTFKYSILAPCVINSIYQYVVKDETERDISSLVPFPFLLWRMIHNQIWISLSRYRTAKGSARIVDKGLEFDQVDRERNWDDQILLNGLILYIVSKVVARASNLPLWRTDGMVITFMIHAGPVEFLYYWFHRALHHHYLYSRYHSHHHSSIVTEPITAVIHPFAEELAYFFLFAIPFAAVLLSGTMSVAVYVVYITYIDFMNNMGHCNFEFIPNRLFTLFPPLKYLMYTPSFHSLHHTQFRTNYSLFMPFYDYMYGTLDRSSDTLHKQSLLKQEEVADVVHLTHLTTLESIYHLRLGFATLASRPYTSTWYLPLLYPITLGSMLLTSIYGRTFVIERNKIDDLKMQTWAIPKYKFQFFLQWQSINNLIEEAIIKADQKGCKVLTLGLLNQGEEMNKHGALYIQRNPKLKVRIVDGSSLAVATVLNHIPKFATQVLLTGEITKLAFALYHSLSKRGIQIAVLNQQHYKKLNKPSNNTNNFEGTLFLSTASSQNIWLVGDGIKDEEQLKAPKGTIFMPFSQFPPKIVRKDCFYHFTPALKAPPSIENVHSCENWLPRRVMSAWRVAGMVHAMEGWTEHECGDAMFDVEKVWQASLRHGFQPLEMPCTTTA